MNNTALRAEAKSANNTHIEDLWQEWLDTKLYLMAKGTPLVESGYEGIYKSQTKEKQAEFIERKSDYAKAAGLFFFVCRKFFVI